MLNPGKSIKLISFGEKFSAFSLWRFAATVLFLAQACVLSAAPKIQKWEYAIINGVIGGNVTKTAVEARGSVCFARIAGCETRQFSYVDTEKAPSYQRAFRNLFAQIISTLGAEGWELVSLGTLPTYDTESRAPAIVLKRPAKNK